MAPADPEAWNDLGVLERKNGETTAALGSFQHATALKPSFVNAVFNLALAYEALNQWQPATKQALRVIELTPALA